jgi:transposase-like protein
VLVELSVVEQRYHAVMEVLAGGVPVTGVAERYGVSRRSVYAWLNPISPGSADPRYRSAQLAVGGTGTSTVRVPNDRSTTTAAVHRSPSVARQS